MHPRGVGPCVSVTVLGIKTAWHLPEEEVTLFSAFNGIGGFFFAWDRLGLAGSCPVCFRG